MNRYVAVIPKDHRDVIVSKVMLSDRAKRFYSEKEFDFVKIKDLEKFLKHNIDTGPLFIDNEDVDVKNFFLMNRICNFFICK